LERETGGRKMHEGRLRLGWKVTTTKGRSAVQFVHSIHDSGGVYYRIGKKTIPHLNCGPLTVFRSKKAAKRFESNLAGPLKINRCVYFVSKAKEVWHVGSRKTSLSSLLFRNKDCIPDPKSVALADWVMLIPEK